MDVQNLRDNYSKLIAYMEESGYSTCYTQRVRREIDRILSGADSRNWASYTDIYLECAKKSSSRQYLRSKLTYLGIIENFDKRGQYPGRRRQKIVMRGLYYLLLPEFKAVIDCYQASEKKRNKKASTITNEASHGASFLYALQQKGITTVDAITERAVLSVFIGEDEVPRRSYSYKKDVAVVFKACIRENSDSSGSLARALAYLPELRERRKNIQYLKPQEVERVKQVLTNDDSVLSFRDRAIGTLALNTGLRCCDIAGLTFKDIDWENEIIHIKQHKTGASLELPLSVAVGNAVYDYLASERPEIECEYIFISEHRPYGRLTDGSLGNISNKIMKIANIRQNAGERKGFHIFRHRIATELLSNGVPQPVISAALGHTSPDSLEAYLSADFKHLKECALSTERFPVPEGVLENV
jgi:integrase